MVSNAARQLVGEQQPQQAPRKKTYQQPQTSPNPVRWSKFERFLVAVGSLVTLCLMISLLSTKISINNQQRHLQDTQTQIAKAKSSNTSLQQEIAELTTQSHLKSAAHKYGLSDKNSNVRNVNK
ncbi:cell division protein FtsL [Limosilactobacillus agrestis]|uniref:Cell division protein FtsL n=1 Tax=Limosilactobacillus agrestis TaxID=2759748 RepID=A0A7W3UHT4_9LACO|nr:cell division protein FtsL [Limosilactobacillus agrestis]MBD5090619.1 cell division protein FtsL [Lactobacillus sp.]MBB1095245.1 cell division protein FtsL [Limosilactobacillus agrestis]MBB1099372.1 cell division protein FtsL [Limosilactobacillus agrestis]MCD7112964.1 cell division protein FtsL [Limosilactobacillus agrestis]MCD7120487.1 cell division protein FtsL [Limosilactobacillus agrestis]